MPKKATKAKKTNKVAPKAEILYTKAEILKSEEFTRIEKDFLKGFLPEEPISLSEAKEFLLKMRKGAVE